MKRSQRLKIAAIKTNIRLISIFSRRKAAQKLFKIFCTPYAKYYRKNTPTQAQLTQFNFEGKNIVGYTWNTAATKRVLLLHGFASAAYKFDAYVQPLVDKGYCVLSFDAPAHGSSQGKTVNAMEYCRMILQIQEKFGPINCFIAHSFAGLAVCLAFEIMMQQNDTKLVLIAPATETTSALNGMYKLLNVQDEALKKEMEQLVFDLSGHYPNWFSIRRVIQNIKGQVLWLHDEDDDITPFADALKVKENNNAHVKFSVSKGLGHNKIYHDEVVKKQIFEFL
jgi:pimeloyl-ACP methyl ester carboxylesterase